MWMHWADITLLIITTHNTQSALDNSDGFSGELHSALDVQSWRMCVKDAAWLRSQVVAPVMEDGTCCRCWCLALEPQLLSSLRLCSLVLLFFTTSESSFTLERTRSYSFCNSQDLPDTGSALSRPQRSAMLICYLTGVLLFLVVLFPFTDPFLYGCLQPRRLSSIGMLIGKSQILKKSMKNKGLRWILTLI
ncbi:CAAX prenyl protease 2-like [Poecilia formosa]|uniref:CAAX prenyl protease 2-like n=1 Tax=Poecilia formosa TaxID=48698 RepID=UPI0007B83BC9|nr:PREDICTED: CAAX prenyl protease 2-like [Poecilia formosa]